MITQIFYTPLDYNISGHQLMIKINPKYKFNKVIPCQLSLAKPRDNRQGMTLKCKHSVNVCD